MKRLSTTGWLGLILAATVSLPLLTFLALHQWLPLVVLPDPRTRLISFQVNHPQSWSNRSWQQQLQSQLAVQHMQVVLQDDNGKTLFASEPGSTWDDVMARYSRGAPGVAWVNARYYGMLGNGLFYGKGLFYGTGERPHVPDVYLRNMILDSGPPIGAGALLTLLLALAALWIRRTLLRPLHALAQAAQGLAEGDYALALPGSPAKEVADVTASFAAMRTALQDAGTRQAELEQERRLLIGAVAHDLRTPLFALRGYLEGLEKGVATTPEQQARYVAICREKADALEHLIADLFAFTRVDAPVAALHLQPLELTTLVSQVVDALHLQAAAKALHLHMAAPESLSVAADPHLLTRALENLLDNALRHTPAGGTVTLDLTSTAEHAIITVTDTGPGLAPQDLPHLFTPFFRSDPSRSRRTGGAGLGLAIAQRIAAAHGGSLAAANAPTGGARFTLRLPLPGSS